MFDWWYRDKDVVRARAGRHPGDPMLTPEEVEALPGRCHRIIPMVGMFQRCRRREGHAGVHQWERVTHGS